MKLFGYKIIALVEAEEVEVTIMDKYKSYTNQSNEDVYLCRDIEGGAYTIRPEDIIKFIN